MKQIRVWLNVRCSYKGMLKKLNVFNGDFTDLIAKNCSQPKLIW